MRIREEIKAKPLSGELSDALVRGLDISTKCIGWSLWRLNGGELYAFGKILVPSNNLFEAMEYGRAEVLKVIAGEDVVCAGLEELNCFLGGDTTRLLCMMGGSIAMALFDQGLHPNFLNTAMIKGKFGAMPQATVNKQLADAEGWSKSTRVKRIMIHRVNERLGTKFVFHSNKEKSDDDIADGVAVGYTLLGLLREESTF